MNKENIQDDEAPLLENGNAAVDPSPMGTSSRKGARSVRKLAACLGDACHTKLQRTIVVALFLGVLVAAAVVAVVLAVAVGADAPAPTAPDYSSLNGYCNNVAPISEGEYAARREKLAEKMVASNIAAFVTEPGATMMYLSDVYWKLSERSFLLVVRANGSSFFVCPGKLWRRVSLGATAFEEGTARERTGPDAEMIFWQENESPFQKVWEHLNLEPSGQTIAVDSEIRAFIMFGLQTAAEGQHTVINGFELIRKQRAIKTDAEIALLRCANQVTKAAIKLVATTALREGMTEDDMSTEMHSALRAGGLRNTWTLILIAENAAYPHGTANRIELKPGHMVLIDTGGELHGYQSDISRTFTYPIGRYTAEQLAWWETVREAQLAALSALERGVPTGNPAGDVDEAARDVLCNVNASYYGCGYETFTHRLGHGIGLQGHEEVYMVQGNDFALESGLCFSVEPGIYLPGRGGVRLEDIACTKSLPPYYEVFGALSSSLADPFAGH